MPNKNVEYERFVRDITEALLRAQGLQTVTVQHDVQIQGTARQHQVDVYWEYRLGGVHHRVVINCKRYAKRVKVTDVEALGGVLADLPGVRGLIVSTIGFEKGAIEYAQHHRIGLKVIRAPRDDDWEGRLRQVHVQLRLHQPELISCNIQLDREWVREHVTDDPDSLVGGVTADATTTTVRDLETNTVSDMNALWNRAMVENPADVGAEGKGTLTWKDALLERVAAPPLRVQAIHFQWKVHEGEQIPLTIRSEPDAIVRDAIAGTLLFVDLDGEITGDVKEELGR
jgi:hypothetical protein